VEAFFPHVEITFIVSEAGGHYHVPLLLSPFGYSTYREAEGNGAGVGAKLLENRYGKSAVRMTKVRRDAATGRHELIEAGGGDRARRRLPKRRTRGATTALCCRPTP